MFAKEQIHYSLSERNKSAIYCESLPLLNSGKLQLLDNTRLQNQLAGLERRSGRGGKDFVDHGPNSHDDLANAGLGALLLAKVRRPMLVSAAALASTRFAATAPRFAGIRRF